MCGVELRTLILLYHVMLCVLCQCYVDMHIPMCYRSMRSVEYSEVQYFIRCKLKGPYVCRVAFSCDFYQDTMCFLNISIDIRESYIYVKVYM
jgi:hypothetical protein